MTKSILLCSSQVSDYVPFAYDATIALAKAIHAVVEADAWNQTTDKLSMASRALVFEELTKVSFTGFSGPVSFEATGDRSPNMDFKINNVSLF